MAKKKKRKIAYVKCEREYGESFYECEACETSLNDIINKYFMEIMLKILEKKLNLLKIYCPQCKRRLNFSRLGIRSSIVNAKVHIVSVKKL